MNNSDTLREEKIKRFTTEPIYPLLVKMAIPSMIGMIVTTVYSMTDTYFVGLLNNTDYTASVGLVFSFVSIIQALGFWFGYGSGNYISRCLGKKDYKSAEKMSATGVILAFISGLLILIGGLIFIEPLTKVLGATDVSLYKATSRYLMITLVSAPIMLISLVLYNQLRLAGAGKESMIGLFIGMLLNMLLDPVFILLLKMNVSGAAFASLIGQAVGAINLYLSTKKNGNIPLHIRKARIEKSFIKEILTGGAPNFCRQGISSISSMVLNNVAAGFGNYAIAAYTIALRITYIAYALVIGFGQGFQPVCAINYGAKKYDRIKKAFIMALETVTVFLVISTIVLYVASNGLSLKFSKEADVVAMSVKIIRANCYILPFMGFYILCGMFLQNIGKFGQATLVTIAENGMFLIPAILILPGISGIEGLIWCKPVASICALILSLVVGLRALKKYLA